MSRNFTLGFSVLVEGLLYGHSQRLYGCSGDETNSVNGDWHGEPVGDVLLKKGRDTIALGRGGFVVSSRQDGVKFLDSFGFGQLDLVMVRHSVGKEVFPGVGSVGAFPEEVGVGLGFGIRIQNPGWILCGR